MPGAARRLGNIKDEGLTYFAVKLTLAIVFSHSNFSTPLSASSLARVILYVSMGAEGLLIFIGTRPRSCD